jgi:thiol-disulfide isomerase/thioredoxin
MKNLSVPLVESIPFTKSLVMIKSLIIALSLLVGGAAFATAELGKDYSLLNPPQPTETKKIEVLEFFFYGCSHCFHLHPLLNNWEKTMAVGGSVQCRAARNSVRRVAVAAASTASGFPESTTP